MEMVLSTLVAAIPATIASLAAWRQSSRTNKKLANGDPAEHDRTVMSALNQLTAWTQLHDLRHKELEKNLERIHH